MNKWQQILISPSQSIQEALLKIDSSGAQIALVADENGRLLGTLSDGDVRRGLLKGMSLTDPVENCMHRSPHTARSGESPDAILARMRREGISKLPILDDAGHIVGMGCLDDQLPPLVRKNWVVVMAGGLGARLGDLTKATPKPMLVVGQKPLLETIVNGIVEQGFRTVFLSVNYLSEIIESHFGNGEQFGAEIRYVRESKRMGTAGSLSLLPECPVEPIIVVNGDLLAKIDYSQMLDVHLNSGSVATMGVSQYETQIPYGVIYEEDGLIQRIEEKPVHTSLISAGVYVLSPAALAHVPPDSMFDMPALFKALIAGNMKVTAYRIRGYWLDIGHAREYQKANADFNAVC